MWTPEQKLHAAMRAPNGREIRRDDTVFVERPGWLQLITPSMPRGSGYLNEITWSAVPDADADRVIEEAIATYHQSGHPVKWCVGPWTKPDDFGARLERRGFQSWNVMGLGIATSATLPASPGVVVREITAQDLTAYTDCSLRGWGMDLDQAPLEIHSHGRAIAQEPRTAHFFVAETGGEIVGTAGIFVRPAMPESPAFGYLVGTQVREQARGRGAYRALVAARLALLASRSVDYAVTHARAETSAPILERLGFETLFESRCYVLSPPDTGATRK